MNPSKVTTMRYGLKIWAALTERLPVAEYMHKSY